MAAASTFPYEDMLRHLQCIVCSEPMYSPIFQCPNGDMICSKCKPSAENPCPKCEAAMGDIRAFALENFAATIPLPCRYREEGCAEIKRYDEKERHELTCKFRPHVCPFPCSPCMVNGDVTLLVKHLDVEHRSTFVEGSTIDTLCRHSAPYNGEEACSNLTIYTYSGNHFCLHFDAFCAPLDIVYMIYITFMGEEVDAQSYRYRLEIAEDTKKMAWTGVPRSIREKRDKMRESCNGLVIYRPVAQMFAENNTEELLTLRVRGCIWNINEPISQQEQPIDQTIRVLNWDQYFN